MNAFERMLQALDGTMERPLPYGAFHLAALAAALAACVLAAVYLRRTSDRANRVVLLIYAGSCLLFEVYKQVIFSFSVSEAGGAVWSYQWYAFPFQFCSTPMYIALFAALIKPGRLQNALYSFLGTFGVLAGVLVMLIPTTVFIETVGINIQTMYHHGSQIVIGVYLLACGRAKRKVWGALSGAPVFAGLMLAALCMNVIFHATGDTANFNMFFIGPYIPCSLLVLDKIYLSAPYPVFLLIYALSFTLGASMVSGLTHAFSFVGRRVKFRIADRRSATAKG